MSRPRSQSPNAEPELPGDLQNLLDQRQVARLLGVTPRHVFTLRKQGLLPFFKFGETVRFHPDHVRECLGKCRHDGGRPDEQGRVRL